MTQDPRDISRSSGMNAFNAEYIDQLYEAFRASPENVSPEWRHYFYGFEHGADGQVPGGAAPQQDPHGAAERLIMAYRMLGHLAADIDPLQIQERERPRGLDPQYYGLDSAGLEQAVAVVSIDPVNARPLGEVVAILERVYCGTVACEHMHIWATEQRRWLEQRLESSHGDWAAQHSPQKRAELLRDLTAAEGLERYLHSQYTGQKRFSLEGADALIPLLDGLVQGAGACGVTDMVLGMAHRGRLNVLVNLLGKAPRELFSEFEQHGEPVRPVSGCWSRNPGDILHPRNRCACRVRRAARIQRTTHGAPSRAG